MRTGHTYDVIGSGCHILGQLREKRAVPVLMTLMADPGIKSTRRGAAIKALCRIGDPKCGPALRKLLMNHADDWDNSLLHGDIIGSVVHEHGLPPQMARSLLWGVLTDDEYARRAQESAAGNPSPFAYAKYHCKPWHELVRSCKAQGVCPPGGRALHEPFLRIAKEKGNTDAMWTEYRHLLEVDWADDEAHAGLPKLSKGKIPVLDGLKLYEEELLKPERQTARAYLSCAELWCAAWRLGDLMPVEPTSAARPLWEKVIGPHPLRDLLERALGTETAQSVVPDACLLVAHRRCDAALQRAPDNVEARALIEKIAAQQRSGTLRRGGNREE